MGFKQVIDPSIAVASCHRRLAASEVVHRAPELQTPVRELCVIRELFYAESSTCLHGALTAFSELFPGRVREPVS
jgi:hypothetical protein